MLFCRKTPISSGVKRSDILRTKCVAESLIARTPQIGGAFVLATRDSNLGYEWRLYEAPLALRLSMRDTQFEHTVLRKTGGYTLRVLLPTMDELGRVYFHPIEYPEYLATLRVLPREKKKDFGKQLSSEDQE
ncbi:MAG: hypothetical protein ACAH17_01500 [Candidatus Paceibacterota bacterium]